jgi:hypothetical protein
LRTLSVPALLLFAALAPAELGAVTVELALEQPDGKPLASAVLAAYPLEPRPLPPPPPATLDQKGQRFVPHILVVQTHSRVSFENSDRVTHHVYSFSPARSFQLYLPKGSPAQSVVFDRPGVVTLGCNIHDWMLGYILVVDTPFFSQTDAAGHARLEGLPAGAYRLELWHPRVTDPVKKLRREVRLSEGVAESWRLRLEKPLLTDRERESGFSDYH